MKYVLSYAMSIASLSVAMPVLAQQTMVVGGQSNTVLRIGTEVPVKTRIELTTKNKALRVGQRFEVETSEPVMLNGRVVIPVGTPGVGEITTVRNKGMWGKSGHFDARVLYLRVGDRQIRLSGVIDDKGVAGGAGAAAISAIVFLPAGFFMTGTSARLPAGTIIKAFLDEDVPVSILPEAVVAPVSAQPVVGATAAPVAPVVPAK